MEPAIHQKHSIVPEKPDFPFEEEEVLKHWKNIDAFKE